VPNVLQAWKSFWMHPMDHLGDVSRVESHFGPFLDCVKCRCKIAVQFAPNELLGDVGHVESHFGLFGYRVSVSAR
jgi:hypothetical protein